MLTPSAIGRAILRAAGRGTIWSPVRNNVRVPSCRSAVREGLPFPGGRVPPSRAHRSGFPMKRIVVLVLMAVAVWTSETAG